MFLTGCKGEENTILYEQFTVINKHGAFEVLRDNDTDIIYYRIWGSYSALTAAYNADGTVMTYEDWMELHEN
jgi:hypothetical protein